MEQRALLELSELALATAEEAGRYVMGGYRAHPAVRTKADVADLVTEYDEGCERRVRERLSAGSDLPIVGEEGGGSLSDAPTWVIDPIDGTTNFVHGHPFFGVSIGVVIAGVPAAGAVVAPALGVSWHGTTHGSFRNRQPIHVSDQTDLRRALVATGFGPTQTPEEAAENVATFHRLLPLTRGIRRDGAASLDLCMTADGTLDAYWEQRLHAWDIAGGAAIALGAGATITDLKGGTPDYTRGFIAVSNGHVHSALLAQL